MYKLYCFVIAFIILFVVDVYSQNLYDNSLINNNISFGLYFSTSKSSHSLDFNEVQKKQGLLSKVSRYNYYYRQISSEYIYSYDNKGRLVTMLMKSVYDWDSRIRPLRDRSRTEYEYDENDNLISYYHYSKGLYYDWEESSSGTYSYDEQGKKIEHNYRYWSGQNYYYHKDLFFYNDQGYIIEEKKQYPEKKFGLTIAVLFTLMMRITIK